MITVTQYIEERISTKIPKKRMHLNSSQANTLKSKYEAKKADDAAKSMGISTQNIPAKSLARQNRLGIDVSEL